MLRGVGGAWRQDAEKWLNRGGAGRSRGVLAEPVALHPLEMAQRRRSQRQGVRKHPAPEGALRLVFTAVVAFILSRQKAPSTRRCIKTANGLEALVGSLASESTQHQKVH